MTTTRKKCRVSVCLFATVALLGLSFAAMKVAQATCFIGYLSSATSCTEADPLGNFQFALATQYYSQGKGPWVMTMQARNNVTDGLVDGSPATFPTSILIFESPGTQTAAGEIVSTNSGTLEDVDVDGQYQLNAWDAIGFACSDSHSVNVRAPGFGCP